MATYLKKSEIGSGGFGRVYRCVRKTDGKVFAMKVLQHDVDIDGQRRFVREVRILAKLDYPNVIRVVGKRLRKKPYWYVMPLYEKSLRDELPGLPGDDVRIDKVYRAILDAVEYAHSEGVIHRDLKPENVLMNNDDDVVLSDFGLGREIDARSTRQTATGFSMGTLAYVAPEQQLDAKSADERADVYALGRMLYEMYTGPIVPSVQELSAVPGDIALIIERATKSRPEDRFETVAALKKAWLSIADAAGADSEYDEMMGLINDLAVSSSMDEDEIGRVLALLARHKDDGEILHEALMALSPDLFSRLHELSPQSMRDIIAEFVSYTNDMAWPFSYTDRIADKCKVLYFATDDCIVRAELVHCVFNVGYGHNRWHVMDIFKKVLEAEKVPGETLAICERLSEESSYWLEQAKDTLSLPKLGKRIRRLFA